MTQLKVLSPLNLWTNPVAVAELLALWETAWPQNKPQDNGTTSMIQEVVDRQQHQLSYGDSNNGKNVAVWKMKGFHGNKQM